MGTGAGFADYVLERLARLELVGVRKMFGEYALYCDGKVVGLLCGNQLFVKPTEPGRAFLGEPLEAVPYPGGRPWFLVGDDLDDERFLTELVRRTAEALPPPAPKKPRARRSKKPR
jgi:TfoX/Sxy family transcriptional regulator of competence genes